MDDLIVNLSTGKIVGCMVGRGENEVVVVPPDRFFPVSEDRIVFTGDSKALKTARPLPRGSSQTSFNTATISEAFRHFGANAPTLPQDALLATASSLLTKTVLSRDNKPLGQVKNLVADVSRGQAVYLVIQPPGRSDDLFVVPPAAFDTKDQGSTLLLQEDQKAFLAGPKVPQRFWTEMTMPEFARQVYGYYNLGGQDATVASTPAGTAGGEPIPTPTGRSDAEIRSALLGEIVNSAAMPAMNAKNLRIQVNDGVVTLSGTVPSERAHEALLSAAKKVAGENRVRDQLQLR
jgi:sporulation protein YlmC with PRC-barrel domain